MRRATPSNGWKYNEIQVTGKGLTYIDVESKTGSLAMVRGANHVGYNVVVETFT